MIDIKDFGDDLKKILDYEPSENLVVSLYLTVGSATVTKAEYTTRLNSMIVEKKTEVEKTGIYTDTQKKNIYETLGIIKDYINESFRPDSTKNLLLYAVDRKIFGMVRLPINIKSRIIIDPKPHTQILRSILNSTIKYAVIVLDRERAQFLTMSMGQFTGFLGAFISEVPPKVNYRSQLAFKEKNILSRIEEKLHHFFKIINEQALLFLRKGKFDNIILAGRKDILSQFVNYLHSFLMQRHIGNILAEPDDAVHVIREKAQDLINKFESDFKNKTVERLINEYVPEGLGVIGPEQTINALMLEQIRTLVYNSEFTAAGYVCRNCGYITIKKEETCPYCKGGLIYYNDITDEIIEMSLNQGCEILDAGSNETLREKGSIGAILRFKL